MEGWLWMCLGQHLLGFILLYSSIILPAWCRPAISSCSTGMIMLGPRCWSQQFRTSYTTATAQLHNTCQQPSGTISGLQHHSLPTNSVHLGKYLCRRRERSRAPPNTKHTTLDTARHNITEFQNKGVKSLEECILGFMIISTIPKSSLRRGEGEDRVMYEVVGAEMSQAHKYHVICSSTGKCVSCLLVAFSNLDIIQLSF